jgi:hypothetical protein
MPGDVTTLFLRSFLLSAEAFLGEQVVRGGTQRTPLVQACATGRFARVCRGCHHLRTAVDEEARGGVLCQCATANLNANASATATQLSVVAPDRTRARDRLGSVLHHRPHAASSRPPRRRGSDAIDDRLLMFPFHEHVSLRLRWSSGPRYVSGSCYLTPGEPSRPPPLGVGAVR